MLLSTADGSKLLRHSGSDVTLQCDFRMRRFHPFANPLVWRKSQWLIDSVEWSTINVMGVLQEPFWSTGRFDISFDQQPPIYHLALKITSKLDCSLLKLGEGLKRWMAAVQRHTAHCC